MQSWLSDRGLSEYRNRLEPLIQASHLLQSRKDEANIDTLCGEITNRLKPKQVRLKSSLKIFEFKTFNIETYIVALTLS